MDREEAIATLEAIKQFGIGKWIFDKEDVEAFDMAIEAPSADRPTVAYICDGRACDADCSECFRTINIEHAKHFKRLGDAYMEQADRQGLEWKPVSEGLPQSVGSYIVTCIDEHGSVYVDYDYWTVADRFKYNCSKVTAWIPFPKPYCGTKMGSDTR